MNNSLVSRTNERVNLQKKAADVAVKFLEMTNNDSSPIKQMQLYGLAAYEAKDFEAAKLFFHDAYELEPSGETAIRLANCGMELADLGFAEDWARKALDSNENGTFKAHVLDIEINYKSVLATILTMQGKADEALEVVAQLDEGALDLDSVACRAAASAKLALGEEQESLGYLMRAKASAPLGLVSELSEEVEVLKSAIAQGIEGINISSLHKIARYPD